MSKGLAQQVTVEAVVDNESNIVLKSLYLKTKTLYLVDNFIHVLFKWPQLHYIMNFNFSIFSLIDNCSWYDWRCFACKWQWSFRSNICLLFILTC